MATTKPSTTTKATPAQAKATPAPATPAPATTTTAPTGTTTTTAQGTPQGQVPALVHTMAALGVVLANPQAAWPGYGKAVRLAAGTGTVYVNRGTVDVRSTPANVARWAKANHGTVRGPQGQYLRMAYSATGTAH